MEYNGVVRYISLCFWLEKAYCLSFLIYICVLERKKTDVLLTVHLSINLVDDQLEAQLIYYIIRLLHSSTFFEQRRAHHQEVNFY